MADKKNIIEEIIEAPAVALDTTVTKTSQMAKTISDVKPIKKSREYWNVLGPGLTTGAADDDPSGIATYSQTGAKYGFQLLWLAPLTFPLMAVVQEMCARIGLVTGRGLAGNIRTYFSRRVLYICTLLLFAANAFNIGADLGAMAQAVRLHTTALGDGTLVIGFGVLMLLMQIFMPYAKYARILKWLAMVLLTYVASALVAHVDWHDVLNHTIHPSLSVGRDQILLICAILGTTISPYLFFWQTSQEVESMIVEGKTSIAARKGATKSEVRNMRVDIWSGMLLSNLVMFFIIAACGATLFKAGITDIHTSAQAAEALRPVAGSAAYYLFSIGIIGTGLLAIPVLAGSSSYAVSESLRWQGGFNRKLNQAHAFYGVLILSMGVGLALNFIGIDPIKALIYSAVANGLVAPVVLALIIIISSNEKIMGEWANRRLTRWLGWAVTAMMTVAGAAAIISMFWH